MEYKGPFTILGSDFLFSVMVKVLNFMNTYVCSTT